MELLGLKVKDRVTGIEGIVTTVSFDLFGCIQAIITPPVKEDGKRIDGWWYDVRRIEILWHTPVMEVPNFKVGLVADSRKGPADKPVK